MDEATEEKAAADLIVGEKNAAEKAAIERLAADGAVAEKGGLNETELEAETTAAPEEDAPGEEDGTEEAEEGAEEGEEDQSFWR